MAGRGGGGAHCPPVLVSGASLGGGGCGMSSTAALQPGLVGLESGGGERWPISRAAQALPWGSTSRRASLLLHSSPTPHPVCCCGGWYDGRAVMGAALSGALLLGLILWAAASVTPRTSRSQPATFEAVDDGEARDTYSGGDRPWQRLGVDPLE